MSTFRKNKSVDSFCKKEKLKEYIDAPLLHFIQAHKNETVLFSKYGRTKNFSTETLNIHFLKSELDPDFRNFDGFLRNKKRLQISFAVKNRVRIWRAVEVKYGSVSRYLGETFIGAVREVSMVKLWNASIVASLIFGMFIMTFIYRYLGQGAAATSNVAESSQIISENIPAGAVLGESAEIADRKSGETERTEKAEDHVSLIMDEYDKKTENQKDLEGEIRKMVKGYPIEKMASFIAQQEPIVAAFLVSIARKESSWGERVPVLNGNDCYNYWGYRGIRKKMGSGGHTCFDSPEDAVKTVAKRIKNIVKEEKITTPQEMVTVWKCGYDCSWDNPAAVKKWVSDVDHYFSKLYKK